MMSKKLAGGKSLFLIAAAIVVALGILAFFQIRNLRKVHSSFDNYYSFRGCTQLIKKTSTYGVCKTNSGETITIVLYQGKWYLKGDLPTGLWGHLD